VHGPSIRYAGRPGWRESDIVLAQPDTPVAATLGRLGITHESCKAAIEGMIGRSDGSDAGISPDDAAALRAFGIDIDEVRSRAEDTFGPGALDLPPAEPCRPPRRILPFRRRRGAATGGHIPFTPRAKRALERSLREAIAMNDRHIGVEHLLLGLLDSKDNLALGLLRRLGTDPAAVRADVLADLGRAA
jgi:hypothetical protein